MVDLKTSPERVVEIAEGRSITVQFEVGGVPISPVTHRVEKVRGIEFHPRSGRGLSFWDPEKKLQTVALADITRIR